MRQLLLYSTSACHLCERAMALLASMPELSRYQLTLVDIAAEDALVERYGTRIPVLVLPNPTSAQGELDWPFNADQVLALLGLD